MKIKKIILILIVILLFIVLGIYCYFNFFREQRIAVLTYHGVVDKVSNKDGVDISTEYFEKQMKWLHDNHYKTITMDEFYEWKIGKKKLSNRSVLITFDDGWRNTYTNALPILEKYGFNFNVFVVWKYSENCTKKGIHTYIDNSDVEDIRRNHKSMHLLSHSYNLHEHKYTDEKNYQTYADDMKIVSKIDSSIQYYAYPFGRYNDEYEKALKDNNYKLAFTFGPYEFASRDDNNYEIPRIGVFENTPFWKFKLKLLLGL